mgnify:CR=1 FL=1
MLELKHVYKVFNEGTPDEKIALKHIDLSLKKGDFLTIIGSNGAGKSTLMNIISGVLQPDYGTVKINDRDVTLMPEHKRARFIGRVFQDPMSGTAPDLTIEENLAIAFSRNRKRSLRLGITRKRREFFREALAFLNLGLENRLQAKVGLLSGGERQALSLLMATFTNPDVLLLDEHTAALDPARAELVTELTGKIVAELGLTTIMVTHNMQQAIDLGNRLIMMDHGEIILDIKEEEKKKLTVDQLLHEFHRIRGKQMTSDREILSSLAAAK